MAKCNTKKMDAFNVYVPTGGFDYNPYTEGQKQQLAGFLNRSAQMEACFDRVVRQNVLVFVLFCFGLFIQIIELIVVHYYL